MPRRIAVNTSYSDREAFVRDVYRACRAVGLPDAGARILTAHACVSSGYGKSLWSYNLFGHKGAGAGACPTLAEIPAGGDTESWAPRAGSDWGHDFQCLLTSERVNGQLVKTRAPFRWFGSLEAAIEAAEALQVRLYPQARLARNAGDSDGYWRALLAGTNGAKWYTSEPEKTRADGARCLAEVNRVLGAGADEGGIAYTLGLALVGAGLLALLFRGGF